MKGILLLVSLFSFTATAAMTESECENQAKTVFTMIEMVESGTLSVSKEKMAKLKKAENHYQKGEYCAARNIVLNLNG
ncbi:hypothetical protein [Vibrio sp. THAF190c]|uniref:hypothetical protein n=1 Tax=Vibrio sp. THAF190c TaxID=2587865 RepID=UPI001267F672|nr:hypothetical protein [Vibrio sp. THAF190c]QFT13328.1 hypothetical protein FIV04_25595 [Vibrio sp. THAF190c]